MLLHTLINTLPFQTKLQYLEFYQESTELRLRFFLFNILGWTLRGDSVH